MPLERDRIVEIVAAVAGVGTMLVVLLLIGRTYGGADGGVNGQGGVALVGAVVFFVLLMAGIGLVLAFVLEDEDEDDGSDETVERDTAENAA